jgi:hypothetical protein
MTKKEIKTTWETQMIEMIKESTSYKVEREYRFHPTRRWRFDAALPDLMTAFEMEGGTWSGGRHIRPAGFEADLEKYNTATLMGWKVYRFVPRMLNQGWIDRILK